MITGSINFADPEGIQSIRELEKMPYEKITGELELLSGRIIEEIKRINNPFKVQIIMWLTGHERFHHGKLLLYFCKTGLKLPVTLVNTFGKEYFPKQ